MAGCILDQGPLTSNRISPTARESTCLTLLRSKTRTAWGRSRRLARIFRQSGRALIITLDHGATSGPIAGLQKPITVLQELLPSNADAFVMHRGLLQKSAVARFPDKGTILHLSAGTPFAARPGSKALVASVGGRTSHGRRCRLHAHNPRQFR